MAHKTMYDCMTNSESINKISVRLLDRVLIPHFLKFSLCSSSKFVISLNAELLIISVQLLPQHNAQVIPHSDSTSTHPLVDDCFSN